MKIARIDHNRCNGTAWHTSYVWVSDEVTQSELEKLCETACVLYLESEREGKKANGSDPGFCPAYEKYPAMKVSEVKREHDERKRLWDEAEKKRKQARKSFAVLLSEISLGRVILFWKHTPDFEVEVNWGHNHGLDVDYGETNPNVNDVPGSLDA